MLIPTPGSARRSKGGASATSGARPRSCRDLAGVRARWLAVRADHAIVDLTGRRVREVGDLRWHELDLDHKVWHLPGAGAKNEKNCDIPLSDQVVAIIQSLPRLDDVLVFPGRRTPPGQREAAARLLVIQGASRSGVATMEPWVLDDLRRTVATGLKNWACASKRPRRCSIASAAAGGGIVGIYRRHDWADEKARSARGLGSVCQRLSQSGDGADKHGRVGRPLIGGPAKRVDAAFSNCIERGVACKTST